MKKITRVAVLITMSLIMCVSPVIAGCFDFTIPYVEAPDISIHANSLCLSWGAVENARKYEVYCNDEMVNIVNADEIQETYVYDFSPHLIGDGNYEFYVVTRANYNVADLSEPSNKVEFEYDSSVFAIPIAEFTDVKESEDFSIAYNINGDNITIDYPDYMGNGEVPEIDGIELYLYSATTGLNILPIEVSPSEYKIISISSLRLKSEIYAVRLGVVIDGQHLICTQIKYINPVNEGYYSSNIYFFDGYINDMYIETIQELSNLIYYSFIHRIPTLEVRVSTPFQDLVKNYTGSNIAEKLGYACYSVFSTILETRESYSISVEQVNKTDFKIYMGYLKSGDMIYVNPQGNAEPDLNLVPTNYNASKYIFPELARDDKYYDSYEKLGKGVLRVNDIGYTEDFISDRQFLYQEVSSSEELYWSIENKITPICKSGSRAELIYASAKEVLKNIISDSMTDYEKVVSIFEWICANTSYDHYSTMDGSYNSAPGTITPSYYLEGVFMTSYAVCDGFSKAFSLMCNMEGIDAIRIVGTAGSGQNMGGHAWNKVLLDEDPTDNIGGEYYVVDATWTTYNANGFDKEVASHLYFLVGDDFIEDTHIPYAYRGKFNAYPASNDYGYYEKNSYKFVDKEAHQTFTYDYIINSFEELKSAFYHMFEINYRTTEIILDYEYMIENFKENASGKKMNYDNIISALISTMKRAKISTQYFDLYNDKFSLIEYNSKGDLGVILVFRQQVCFDDVENTAYEIGNLINYVNLYQPKGTLELVVKQSFIDAIKKFGELSTTALIRVLQAEISKTTKGQDGSDVLLYSHIKSMTIENLSPLGVSDDILYSISFEYNE